MLFQYVSSAFQYPKQLKVYAHKKATQRPDPKS
jgi:hypothetical protein